MADGRIEFEEPTLEWDEVTLRVPKVRQHVVRVAGDGGREVVTTYGGSYSVEVTQDELDRYGEEMLRLARALPARLAEDNPEALLLVAKLSPADRAAVRAAARAQLEAEADRLRNPVH